MEKISQIRAILICIICAIIIGTSSALMLLSPTSTTKSTYILREYKGKLALYDAQMLQIYAEYDIYTQLLPQSDVDTLRQGIIVNTPQELDVLLEDYGA